VGLLIHTADIQDKDAAVPLLAFVRRCYPWLRHVFADGGYDGQKLVGAPRGMGGWTVQIVKRSDASAAKPDNGTVFKALHATRPLPHQSEQLRG